MLLMVMSISCSSNKKVHKNEEKVDSNISIKSNEITANIIEASIVSNDTIVCKFDYLFYSDSFYSLHNSVFIENDSNLNNFEEIESYKFQNNKKLLIILKSHKIELDSFLVKFSNNRFDLLRNYEKFSKNNFLLYNYTYVKKNHHTSQDLIGYLTSNKVSKKMIINSIAYYCGID